MLANAIATSSASTSPSQMYTRLGAPVDLAHLWNLHRLIFLILLVDAQGVNPEVQRLVRIAQVSQDAVDGRCDSQTATSWA